MADYRSAIPLRVVRILLPFLTVFSAGVVVGTLIGSRGGIPFIDREETWAIGVYEGPSPFMLEDPFEVENPVIKPKDITDLDARFVADPFVIERDSDYFMFFEILDRQSGKGKIGLAVSVDGLDWTYHRVVLDEPFHLSYPYVFEWEGNFYMIPESEEAKSVRLYKAIRFPYEWELNEILLEGYRFVDPSLLRDNDRWWLFVSEVGSDVLRLYHAEALSDPWTEHLKSPLIEGNSNIARPGGRVFRYQDRIVRLAQDDYPNYGTSVVAFFVEELTTTDYSEVPITESIVLEGDGTGWNSNGMHHLDPHFINQRWLGFVDGRTTRIVFGFDR